MENKKYPYLMAIDPGTTESGVCIVRCEDSKPIAFAKIENTCFEDWFVRTLTNNDIRTPELEVVFERMQGRYNGPVGAETFISCEWIGRFETILQRIWKVEKVGYILRSQEYKVLCGKLYAHNDSGVRQALVDMFAFGEPNFGKGNKKNPGWFFGFSKDVWASYAQAISYMAISNGEA